MAPVVNAPVTTGRRPLLLLGPISRMITSFIMRLLHSSDPTTRLAVALDGLARSVSSCSRLGRGARGAVSRVSCHRKSGHGSTSHPSCKFTSVCGCPLSSKGVLGIFIRFKVFHGTKLAQTDAATIERTKLFFLSAEAHNLKVIGSNPIPATKLTPPGQ
jgi:hypothetical protein